MRYLGLVRIYEDEWKDRVTEKLGKRIFYDEKEWRALKLMPDQGNLKFTEKDIVAVIINRESDKKYLANYFSSKTDDNMIDIKRINRKIITLKKYVKRHN